MTTLTEASLVRLFQHTESRNVAILSAFRGRYTKSENLARSSKLEAEIRAAGYGFYKIEGRYIEGFGSEQSKEVKERAIFVIGKLGDDKGALKGLVKKLGAKYNQDSVLFKPFDGKKAVLIGTQAKDEDGNPVQFPGLNVEYPVGEFKPMKVSQFYSKMKGKPFVFESFEQADTWSTAYAKYLQLKQTLTS